MASDRFKGMAKKRFRNWLEGRYDYIEKMGIIRLNREDGWGCTLKECVEIFNELYAS